jgi:DNA-binding NarL/FixJ family response regulator
MALTEDPERRLSRVASLSHEARVALAAGRARECLALVDQFQEAAGDDQAAQVWALTASAGCRAVLGQLARAQEDLALVRKICNYTAPVLAEPFWRFAGIVCNWQAGGWVAAQEDAAALGGKQLGPVTPVVSGIIAALRTELLRGLGRPQESRLLAGTLSHDPGNGVSAWSLAGLVADAGHLDESMRRLQLVCDAGAVGVNRAVLPMVLHRMAEVAFALGDLASAASAADALAEVDQSAPLAEILTGLAQSYATSDPAPARRAQRLAEAQGAWTLAAEALTVRARISDDRATTFPAAHAAWRRIGATGRARTIATAMRAAGLRVPAPRRPEPPSTPAPAAPPALTTRERHLARLVHEGRTNQQISTALDISVKTVEAYLTRLYRKTGCSSRVDLAVAVTEHRIHVDK